MITENILMELEFQKREANVQKDILLDPRRRERYLSEVARRAILDEKVAQYERQVRVNY